MIEMMKRILGLIVIISSVAVAVGCGCGRGRGKINRDMRQLAGSHIRFPPSLLSFEGQEIIPFETDDSKAHIVIYYDTAACGTCLINSLPEWHELMDSVEMLCPDVDFIFVMSPQNTHYNTVLRSAVINNADYNIAIDKSCDFAKYNPQIPDDERLHTFLTDRTGEVVVVGSPLHNQAIWRMYKNALVRIAKQ